MKEREVHQLCTENGNGVESTSVTRQFIEQNLMDNVTTWISLLARDAKKLPKRLTVGDGKKWILYKNPQRNEPEPEGKNKLYSVSNQIYNLVQSFALCLIRLLRNFVFRVVSLLACLAGQTKKSAIKWQNALKSREKIVIFHHDNASSY